MTTQKILVLAFIGFFTFLTSTAQVGIGTTTPDASAILETNSTTRGFLPPRMNSAQRNAIVSPAQGLMIYCTNCGIDGQPQYYNGSAWVNLQGTAPANATPILSTTIVSSITGVSGSSGGDITSDEGSAITARGLSWSLNPNPTTSDFTAPDQPGTTTGSFTSNMTELQPETIYYVRAYATNSAGTNYGNEVSFTTGILALGDPFAGGFIAYFLTPSDTGYDPNVQHGLIVAQSDVTTSRWYVPGPIQNTIIGTSEAIGAGSANTDAIIAVFQNTGSYAARASREYNGGGYTDWYLPSIGDLNKLAFAIPILNAQPNFSDILQNGAINFYWSSSEGPINPQLWAISRAYGPNGSIQIYWDKNRGSLTRPFRSF